MCCLKKMRHYIGKRAVFQAAAVAAAFCRYTACRRQPESLSGCLKAGTTHDEPALFFAFDDVRRRHALRCLFGRLCRFVRARPPPRCAAGVLRRRFCRAHGGAGAAAGRCPPPAVFAGDAPRADAGVRIVGTAPADAFSGCLALVSLPFAAAAGALSGGGGLRLSGGRTGAAGAVCAGRRRKRAQLARSAVSGCRRHSGC